ncbi:MAG: hypothetical protein HDR19_02135 [Lachnospiraceae bacterium]|nr:hypothetical protein [Lachnospiraceae bacterium]
MMVVMKRFFLILLNLGLFLSIVIFLISIYLFFHGSFEMFPTEEQEEKAKIFATFLGVLSFVVGVLLAKWRNRHEG